MVLRAAAGKQDLEIAAERVSAIRRRRVGRSGFLTAGLAGLERDTSRAGRTPTITEAKVQEVIRKLNFIDAVTLAKKQIHLIADNYATHKHPKVHK